MILLLKVLALASGVACFVSFGWAMKKFFVAPSVMTSGMKLLSTAGLLFFIAHLARLITTDHTTAGWLLGGVALYATSLWLFWSAVRAARGASLAIAFSGGEPKAVVREGPYRFVRHPFYAAYALFWSAGVCAAREPLLVPTALIMIAVYVSALRKEEALLLQGPFAQSYREYREETGALLPRLRRGTRPTAAR